MGEKVVKLVFEKETKNMVRYVGEFGVQYVPKSAFEGEIPKEMTLRLNW